LTPSEPSPDPATAWRTVARNAGLEDVVAALIAEALADATPRAAARALLRFDDYLAAVARAGIEICADGALASALRVGLSRVCRADGSRRAEGDRLAARDESGEER
jgi:hypothetical protein